ncbi:MAG: phenylalanine--tRNA ligase subunit beta [Conexivisphaerales archaeon]
MDGEAGALKVSDLVKTIVSLGIHLESEEEEVLKLEYDPNRPDFSSDYGIARALKGRLGLELGAPKHKLKTPSVDVLVDSDVGKVRPYISCLIARQVSLDDESIRQLISMQEDLHNGIGRKRKKFAIGLHNLDVLKPPIHYTVADPTFRFIPLGYSFPMPIEQVLQDTEVGRRYGSLVKGNNYPLLKDSGGTVLSVPPIVNGVATEVKSNTRNLFVDVTGTERRLVDDALAIISEALADAGAKLEKVRIKEAESVLETPELNMRSVEIKPSQVKNLLGLDLEKREIIDSLLKTRFDAVSKGNCIMVKIPRYRVDILHPVDLIEEVAYGYGFENLKPDFGFSYSKGEPDSLAIALDSVRRLFVGLGFQEIVNYSLISRESLYQNLLRDDTDAVRVESSKTQLYEYLRDTLVAGMLEILYKNIHQEYPQKLFEIGYCFFRDKSSETGIREELILCAALSAEKASFSDIRSVLDTFLLKLNNIKPEYKQFECSYLAEGRAASCMVSGKSVGYAGEVKPEVLVNFGLRMPVSLLEVKLLDLLSSKLPER